MSLPSDYLLKSSREYSIYVCEHRSIPNVQDGLKTSQRLALWLLRDRDEKIKTFSLAGLMGYSKLYHHGEASANNAIGLLAAPYKNNVPLIEGVGQFGSRLTPVEGIGAPRYTSVKRSKAAQAFLYNDLDIVPLEENFDGSNMQPTYFLPIIPVVLLNGVIGVAVGYSTEILPRSLIDLIDATKCALTGKQIKKITPNYCKYDLDIIHLAGNQWELSGKINKVKPNVFKITELPPGMNVDNFRKRLIQMEENNEIEGFTDSSVKTIQIEIRMKRGLSINWTNREAIDFFKLREKVTERIVVVDWNGDSIRQYETAEQLIKEFAEWRLGWYVKRYERLLSEASHDLVYWKLLKALFENGFTKKLGTFANKAAVTTEVEAGAKKAKLSPDDHQIERATGLPTYRWTKDFKSEVEQKIAEIDASIIEYRFNLDNPERIRDIYISELEELKKLKL